jgi:hypothetical protein
MQRCWICTDYIKDSILLPYHDDYFDQGEINVFRNTFIIKEIGPFKFLYFTCCNKCIDNYLIYYGRLFKYVKGREIGM